MIENTQIHVIDGLDGSGKASISTRVVELLNSIGVKAKRESFPDYDSDSSYYVRQYLSGEYGSLDDIGPFEASMFYMMDRYDFFKRKMEELKEYDCIIFDRYTTSNLTLQSAKIADDEEKIMEFVNLINHTEYDIMKIPKPDSITFLDMDPAISQVLIDKRNQAKIEAGTLTEMNAKDIHEKNTVFLNKAYARSLFIANKEGWEMLRCCRVGTSPDLEVCIAGTPHVPINLEWLSHRMLFKLVEKNIPRKVTSINTLLLDGTYKHGILISVKDIAYIQFILYEKDANFISHIYDVKNDIFITDIDYGIIIESSKNIEENTVGFTIKCTNSYFYDMDLSYTLVGIGG